MHSPSCCTLTLHSRTPTKELHVIPPSSPPPKPSSEHRRRIFCNSYPLSTRRHARHSPSWARRLRATTDWPALLQPRWAHGREATRLTAGCTDMSMMLTPLRRKDHLVKTTRWSPHKLLPAQSAAPTAGFIYALGQFFGNNIITFKNRGMGHIFRLC